ncbi:DUF4153 domain-containing protein [Allosphingosinicella deserti]|uniref:DUF4173 domain-containing protein n=1 Tax=Allosphingosinicella deserti TaxID=2116704 RepID=A0A2P7QIF8_9SPHN|nr:DUF4173 domain-containing protein [Sphingomonas deserti]PSJ37730.1 DUF4173 domain-containing protein [Sphingomonas deserti]
MYLDAVAPASSAGKRGRFSFGLKLFLAVSLLFVADRLFYGVGAGSTAGLFAGLLIAAAALARPAIRRSVAASIAAGAALLFAVALFADPSLLAAALFWAAVSMMVLLPRIGFDNGLRWAVRVGYQLVAAAALPFRDFGKVQRARRRRARSRTHSRIALFGLPFMGSLVFLALFARANPLIGEALSVEWSEAAAGLSFARLGFWLLSAVAIWSLLRPALLRLGRIDLVEEDFALPGVSLASVTLSLIAFNLIFALQNALDVAFLWSGAPLPGDLTLADYAHRGAYPLIATALLAALFVLVTLRPGTEMAESRLVRRLVSVWIAQNVLLVASTMLRTIDYVEAYSLTILRISALLWMALVAIGLMLICWRLWGRKSARWLINANLLAAGLLLSACAFVDLGAVAASWNVRHAREAGGKGAALDLCYLGQLGDSALLPVIELESRIKEPAFRGKLAWIRNTRLLALEARQRDWRTWTMLGARRLEAARTAASAHRLPRFAPDARGCDAAPAPLPPPPVVAQPAPPLPSAGVERTGTPAGVEPIGTPTPAERDARTTLTAPAAR